MSLNAGFIINHVPNQTRPEIGKEEYSSLPGQDPYKSHYDTWHTHPITVQDLQNTLQYGPKEVDKLREKIEACQKYYQREANQGGRDIPRNAVRIACGEDAVKLDDGLLKLLGQLQKVDEDERLENLFKKYLKPIEDRLTAIEERLQIAQPRRQ